jgi:hypothetical protein
MQPCQKLESAKNRDKKTKAPPAAISLNPTHFPDEQINYYDKGLNVIAQIHTTRHMRATGAKNQNARTS